MDNAGRLASRFSSAELTISAGHLGGHLDPGMFPALGGHVKSRKHEWKQACFIPDLADAVGLTRVVQRFVELQEEFLAGGVVLRTFEVFAKLESVAAEVRVWWLDGEPRLLTPHPDSPFGRGLVPDFDHIGPAVQRLGCRFVTTRMRRSNCMTRRSPSSARSRSEH